MLFDGNFISLLDFMYSLIWTKTVFFLLSVGTRIGESCTTSVDTCVDDKAVCNGTVCDCMQGFQSNGSICGKQYYNLIIKMN